MCWSIFNVCLLDFYTIQILTSTTVIIVCISWLIKVSVKSMFTSLSNFIALCVCDSENVRVFDRSNMHQGWPCRAETCSRVE
jgi:hypothetical protein